MSPITRFSSLLLLLLALDFDIFPSSEALLSSSSSSCSSPPCSSSSLFLSRGCGLPAAVSHPLSQGKINSKTTNAPLLLCAASSRETSERSDGEEDELIEECGPGFYKQTGPDGDYCVLDYDSLCSTTKTAEVAAMATNTELNSNNEEKDEHYWDALESQNAARRKFGLPDLTPEQYVALQAENHLTAQRQVVEATAQAFEQFDTNKDGVVCVKELREGMQKILQRTDHLSASQAQKVMDHFDDNGDGFLQPDEFITIGEIRGRLDAVIEYEREEMMLLSKAEQDQRQKEQQQQQEQEEQEQGGISLVNSFFNMFVDTCESNFDCERPEVCCDFGYRKTCCSSGRTAKQMQLEYATVPVPQNIG